MGESKPKSEREGISREALLFRAKNFARSNRGEAVPIESLSYKEFAGAEQVLKDFEDPQSPEARQLADFIETSKKIDAGIFEKIQDEVIFLNTQIRTENFRPLSERMCQQLEERLVEMSPDIWEAVSAVIEKSREKNEEQEFEDERRRAKREIQTGVVNRDMETVNEIMLAMKGDLATHFPDREIPTLSEAERSDLLGRIQELGLQISLEQEYFLKNGKLMEERKPQKAQFFDFNGKNIEALARAEAEEQMSRDTSVHTITPPEPTGFLHRINKSPIGNFFRKALFSAGILAAGAGAAKAETPHHSGGRDRGGIEHVESSRSRFIESVVARATHGFEIKDQKWVDAARTIMKKNLTEEDLGAGEFGINSYGESLQKKLLEKGAIVKYMKVGNTKVPVSEVVSALEHAPTLKGEPDLDGSNVKKDGAVFVGNNFIAMKLAIKGGKYSAQRESLSRSVKEMQLNDYAEKHHIKMGLNFGILEKTNPDTNEKEQYLYIATSR